MDWSKDCYNGCKFEIVVEYEDRWICRCILCGSEFTRWKR